MSSRPKSPTKQGKIVAQLVVRPAPLDRRRAILQAGSLRLPAAIGRSGRTSRKREGDGATPIATMPLRFVYHRGDRMRVVATGLPLKRVQEKMLWCDASGHPSYNRPVTAPFRASHETLMRQDRLYDVCVVMDWNLQKRKRGCGSAIFFHIAHPDYAPTEGCVAISPRDMQRLLPHLGRATRLRVL
ncbi:MAG: L,D-transpeptidase family protein [Rhizobium sp.]|nr:L,D-transpeptidase family protein [Rhizobium sp.]